MDDNMVTFSRASCGNCDWESLEFITSDENEKMLMENEINAHVLECQDIEAVIQREKELARGKRWVTKARKLLNKS